MRTAFGMCAALGCACVTGAQEFSLPLGGAILFDGVDDSIMCPTIMGPAEETGGFTVEAWCRPTGDSSGGGRGSVCGQAVSLGSGCVEGPEIAYRRFDPAQPPSIFGVVFNPAGCNNEQQMLQQAIEGEWVHVAITFDGSVGRFFLNGVLAAEDTGPMRISTVSEFYIGSVDNNFGTPNAPFMGEIDEVRVWDHARSGGQIRRFAYGELTGLESGLLAYYDFNGADSGVVVDRSPNGYHGTVRGDPEVVTGDDWGGVCVADLNEDGLLDLGDVGLFVESFIGGCP